MRVASLELLLRDPPSTGPAPDGVLTDLAGLEDAQVLEVRHDVARSQAGVLLDCRQSGALGLGNAAVVTAGGVSALRWSRQAEVTRVHAIRVVAGGVTRQGPGTTLTMACEPHSDLVVTAATLSLHVVAVPGLPVAPVDYGSSDAEIRAGTPSWGHPADVLASWSVA